MRKKGLGIVLCLLSTCMLSGCTAALRESLQESEEQEDGIHLQVTKEDSTYQLEDDWSLYEDDDETSVITMYLTVSSGNAAENTNHTWREVNTYSTYYYDDLGIERYAVNGLLQVGDEAGPLEGELGYDRKIPNATVTVRGQTSSQNAQKSYKIELKDGSGTWNDQRVINLNKHQSDGMRFKNKLAFDLMKEIPGMMALQTQFVHLYVRDTTAGANAGFVDYGLYTQVEQPNKSFLSRHGLDKNGQLYKINFFEFFRYEDTIMLKSDADYDVAAFEKMLEIKGDDDHSKLIAMLEDLNDYSIPIEEVMAEWFDVDNLTSWLAFHILTGNIDTQSRNTLLYSPLNSNTWYFISWDNDDCLSRTEALIYDPLTEFGWEKGVSNYWGNILFQRLLKSESFREALDAKVEEYLGILTEEKLADMIAGYAEVVKPYVYGAVDSINASLTPAEYDIVRAALPSEIAQNYEYYKESFETPMPFYLGTPEQADGSVLFQWEASYDLDMETVSYSFELADNYLFENPIVTEEALFIPEYQYAGKLAPGQYFYRVIATDESGHTQTAFDYYITDGTVDKYGVISFFVFEDGGIQVETYEE